ncbi:hypothetical protein [Paludisphaera mucosa]|uniref:Uncharacterized protein n=1 Tax=Paludisphaera mucosa TaxID=3030827 RepID=A0ABT6F9H0_9BACT|nr:hypothetical protein [Paludisphaera mucosa]MDG3004239.1 hypothetical protein [Paludisphaera mucosa]
MVHFTCDLCGKDITSSGEDRFVVKMEAFPGFDPNEIKEEDLEDDPMEAVSDMIQRDEAFGPLDHESADDACRRKGFRFDLCPSCHGKFLRDPLGKSHANVFDFSKN